MNWDLLFNNYVDVIVAIVLILGILQGIRRKLSGEIASLISMIIAVACGFLYFRPMGSFLLAHSRLSENGSLVLGYFVCFAVAWFVLHIVRVLLRAVLEIKFKGGLDGLGGACAGFLRAAIFSAATLYILSLTPNPAVQQAILGQSAIGKAASINIPTTYNNLSERFKFLPALDLPVPTLSAVTSGKDKPTSNKSRNVEDYP